MYLRTCIKRSGGVGLKLTFQSLTGVALCRSCRGMAGFMESEAVFAHRLQSLGLADFKVGLAENHVETWGGYGFRLCLCARPG